MRAWCIGLVFLLGLLCPCSVQAQEARKLIERALRAQWGKDKPVAQFALRARLRGKFYVKNLGAAGNELTALFALEMIQAPRNRRRTTMDLSLLGQKVHVVQVSDGHQIWVKQNGAVNEAKGTSLQDAQEEAYRNRVTKLVPLLDPASVFTLQVMGEKKRDGKTVVDLKVSHKGYPDLTLSFDRKTGLLVRVSGKMRSGINSVSLDDYRPLSEMQQDEKILRDADLPVDARGLFRYLARQKVDPGGMKKAQALITRLGADDFEVRERAQKGLASLGKVARPVLEKAIKESKDAEVVRRARACLKKIVIRDQTSVSLAAVRLLATRKPTGTVELFLDLIPSVRPELAREMQAALYSIHRSGKRPHPALQRALKDTHAIRRASAEGVLGKDGGKYLARPGRRLYLPGLKLPTKMTYYQKGKKIMDAEVLEGHLFNDLDDKLFGKP